MLYTIGLSHISISDHGGIDDSYHIPLGLCEVDFPGDGDNPPMYILHNTHTHIYIYTGRCKLLKSKMIYINLSILFPYVWRPREALEKNMQTKHRTKHQTFSPPPTDPHDPRVIPTKNEKHRPLPSGKPT